MVEMEKTVVSDHVVLEVAKVNQEKQVIKANKDLVVLMVHMVVKEIWVQEVLSVQLVAKDPVASAVNKVNKV
jgi:hypothetical protein